MMDGNFDIGQDYPQLLMLLRFFGVSWLADADPVMAGALCVWREARGEGMMGRRGVAHVLNNRTQDPSWWGHTWLGVIFRNVVSNSGKRIFQFSSFNQSDPNAIQFPSAVGRDWLEIKDIVAAVLKGSDDDITNGAEFYHDSSISFPATWGRREDYKMTLAVGRFCFYRFEPLLSNHGAVQDAAMGEA
jgi:hypothetical protein